MARALTYTAEFPRIHTEFGLVRLDWAWYQPNSDFPQVAVVARLFGRHAPAGDIRFYDVHWDDRGNAHTAEGRPRKKAPDTIETCADRVVDEYLRQNPGWLKAQLNKNLRLDGPIKGNPLWNPGVRHLITDAYCCAHWSSTYQEPIRGRSPAEWAAVLKSIEDFKITIRRHAGFEDAKPEDKPAAAAKPKLLRAA